MRICSLSHIAEYEPSRKQVKRCGAVPPRGHACSPSWVSLSYHAILSRSVPKSLALRSCAREHLKNGVDTRTSSSSTRDERKRSLEDSMKEKDNRNGNFCLCMQQLLGSPDELAFISRVHCSVEEGKHLTGASTAGQLPQPPNSHFQNLLTGTRGSLLQRQYEPLCAQRPYAFATAMPSGVSHVARLRKSVGLQALYRSTRFDDEIKNDDR